MTYNQSGETPLAKIIDLKKACENLKANSAVNAGIKALEKLTAEERAAAMEVLAYGVAAEVAVGLGVHTWEEFHPGEPEPKVLKYYSLIQSLYDEAEQDCYFCNQNIDPAKTPFPKTSVKLCTDHIAKLKSFLTAISDEKVDVEKIFQNMN